MLRPILILYLSLPRTPCLASVLRTRCHVRLRVNPTNGHVVSVNLDVGFLIYFFNSEDFYCLFLLFGSCLI